jgi:hypothetical protein
MWAIICMKARAYGLFIHPFGNVIVSLFNRRGNEKCLLLFIKPIDLHDNPILNYISNLVWGSVLIIGMGKIAYRQK